MRLPKAKCRPTVDQPQRFVHSRAVGTHVGLTPRRHQSGEIDYDGAVFKSGDTMLRTMLYEKASPAAPVRVTRSRDTPAPSASRLSVGRRPRPRSSIPTL
jgi:transposase